mmetsp:Transcript_2283/g.5893  ORF Transcript_2283/g.5893 Transcript_2283/m.5893 type:complete len:160 (-) Transcript_2283:125-604(-)
MLPVCLRTLGPRGGAVHRTCARAAGALGPHSCARVPVAPRAQGAHSEGAGGSGSGSAPSCYVAYTKGLPNRFLAPASVPAFAKASVRPTVDASAGDVDVTDAGDEVPSGVGAVACARKWLVGEVRRIDGPLVATEGSEEAAVLNLRPGAQYWLLSAEPV